MNKCLVFILEGDTEKEFYKYLVQYIKKKHQVTKFSTQIEYLDVKGVGCFKKIAGRKFEKVVKKKYGSDCEYTVVLCRDTDVFELSPKPPVKWEDVKKDFLEKGASRVIDVKAKHSIEDWFLYDLDGIAKFLKVENPKNLKGKNGYEKLQNLYKKANKVYYKGSKSNGLIQKLSMDVICQNVDRELKPLYTALGV